MKKIITSAFLILLSLTWASAQINLEASYTNFQMDIIRLSAYGSKYLTVTSTNDAIQDTIQLFNLDHTIFKTIIVPSFPAPNGYGIEYVSDALFDTDSSDIEYLMWVGPSSIPGMDGKIKVFEESGNLLLDLDSAAFGYSWPQFNGNGFVPIVETDSGAKFITFKYLFSGTGGSYYNIYSLPGHLPCNLCGGNNNSTVAISEPHPAFEDLLLSNPYPNPANSTIKIEYHLPNDSKKGSIAFYDTYGNFIKSYSIDHHSQQLILNAGDFASGTYLYRLMTDRGRSIGKKILIVK